jgi:peptidyl-prolyl cis-trans isomerase C/peptidyl-prolyl cis-trans isomerase SurA
MPDEIRASHILVDTKSRSKEEAQTAIEGIISNLQDGGEFAKLAEEHSDCPSGSDGGDLGNFGKGAMVPEFETAAFNLEIGETSEAVETSFGIHLIHRTE